MKNKIIMISTLLGAFYAISWLLYKFVGFNTVNYSIFYVISFTGVFYILKYKLHSDETLIGNNCIWVLACLFSLAVVTGFYFDNNLPFEVMGIRDILNYFVCVIGLSPLFKCFFGMMFKLIEKWAGSEKKTIIEKESGLKIFFISFTIIIACWLFVWLAYYPGLWNYDPWQVNQFTQKEFSKYHPLIHTLLLSVCYCAGVKINSANLGVILYDFVQMLIMAGIFAYTYVYIHKHVFNKFFRGIVLLFYAVFPVNSILVISTTKDVIFSGLVLLCLVFSIQIKEVVSSKQKNVLLLLLLAACVAMLLFRNNAIYAFYLFAILTLVITGISKDRFFRGGGIVIYYMLSCAV